MMSFEQPVIMIVDDEPHNLNVLEGMLRQNAYRVVAFPRGDLALDAAKTLDVDVVLLDIRMPGLDGYEVCRRLKQMACLKDVPVIFLSALTDPDDKVRAFEAGGVDYVTKPLSEPEVLARVKTHLDIRRHTLHLHELVQAKAADLAAAHRRLQILDAAKTHWIATLAHEMRTPLTGILCVTDILFNETPAGPQASGLRDGFENACRRIKKLIDDATLLARTDVLENGFEVSDSDLLQILAAARDESSASMPDVKHGTIRTPTRTVCIRAAPGLLRRALAGLYHVAGCCVSTHGQISTTVRTTDRNAVIEISANKQPLPPEDLATFFEIGGQRTLFKGGADFGLSPVLSSRIIRLLGGDVSVWNTGPHGFTINVLLPLHGEPLPGTTE